MALISKASLLMVPSTYEPGTLYNVLPSGNRAPDSTDQNSGYDQTRADFDFDRGSNAAATRVNADGLIEKYRENLLLQSNQFDTTWGKVNISATSGQEGYDGKNNAWKIEGTGSAAFSYLLQSESNNIVKTRSVYAKAGSVSYLGIWGSGSNFGYFDLSNGTLDNMSGSSAIAHSITDVGNGWYRCEFVSTGSSSSFYIVPSLTANGTSLSTGQNIYIQSAQLESGLVATDVLTSGATTAKAGVLVDMPRINYDANGENGALLLEPSRQNLVVYSEYLNGGIWIQTGSSVTDNDSTSPEGLTNAAKVEGDGSQTYIRLYDNLTFPSTGNYTLSVFAKAGNNDFLRLVFGGVTGGNEAYFDLVNGTTEETWASIEPVGTDGWYRCSITADLTGPDLTGNYNSYVSYSYTDRNFPSAGDANGQYVYLYGFQVEANATYPSSYIPNNGESGGVTRAADSCLNGGNSDVFNDSEGVLFIESSAIAEDSTNKVITISDGTTANRVQIYYNSSNGIVGGVAGQSAITYSGDITETTKIAFKYKANDFALWVNGVEVGTDNVGSAPSGLNQINFHNGASGSPFYGNMKQLVYFNEALSDSELATLTTL